MPDLDPTRDTTGAPSDEGGKLVKGSYADRALAALQQERLMNGSLLLRTLGIFDPDNITHRDRRRMRQDLMIKMGLWYTKAPLIRADYVIECEDPAIAAGMKEIVENTYISDMKIALNMLDFGFQGAIKQYALGSIDATFEDPQTGEQRPVWDDDLVQPVVFGDMVPLPPESTRVSLEQGRFGGIITPLSYLTQGGGGVDTSKPVPPEWCLWFVNEFEEEFRNWYGRARIDPSYRAWYSYWFIHHMRDRHAENDADPALQVWYPPGTQRDSSTNAVTNNRDVALQVGQQLRGGATIAWPSDVHVGEDGRLTTTRLWEAAFLTGGENLAAFTDILADLEIQKLRGVLVPEQALVEARRGTSSRNASATFVDIFTQSLEQTAQYLDHLWNKYRLRPVVEANWGKDAPPVKKKTTGFQEEDLSLASTLLELAFQSDPNAIPIKWEEVVSKLGLPMYSKAEQKEREEAAQEAQQAEGGQPQPPPGQGGQVAPLPGGQQPPQTPSQLAASQQRPGPRKYEREVIYLHQGSSKVDATTSLAAHAEAQRRSRSLQAIAERLGPVAEAAYADAFHAAAEALADMTDEELADALQLSQQSATLELGLADLAKRVAGKIGAAVQRTLDRWRDPLQGEMASIYHAAGAAELSRLGLSADSWDVGRDEVQEWARYRAGELVKTIDGTVVENYIRPWLAHVLQDGGYPDYEQGIPVNSVELATRLTDKFSSYPHWMAERLVRTEARMGFNASAADMWERVGVQEVDLWDGLGGKSGQTDPECLARNGQRVTIEEFRRLDREEHPNGTLGGVPVPETVQLRPLEDRPRVLQASQSRSIYAVRDGEILGEAETGALLA